MVAVLLDGSGGKDEQGAVFGQSFDLLPVKIGEVARGWDPGVHGALLGGGLRCGFEGDHLAGVEETARVVFLFGEELNVVFAVTSAAFNVIDVRVGDGDADGAAKGDHFVETLLGSEADERD